MPMDTNADATHGCNARESGCDTGMQLPHIKGSGGWGISLKQQSKFDEYHLEPKCRGTYNDEEPPTNKTEQVQFSFKVDIHQTRI